MLKLSNLLPAPRLGRIGHLALHSLHGVLYIYRQSCGTQAALQLCTVETIGEGEIIVRRNEEEEEGEGPGSLEKDPETPKSEPHSRVESEKM